MKKIERKYRLFDCKEKPLGRMSSEIAFVLQGKHKAEYTPNKDAGDYAVVINSDKLKVTGNKRNDKVYHNFSGYPGGIASRNLNEMLSLDSRKIVEISVRGMLPKNKIQDRMMKRLLVFKDDKHNLKIS